MGRGTGRRELGGYAAALVLSLAAFALRWVLDPLLGPTAQFLTFYFSVLAACVFAGPRAGLAAIVLGGSAGIWLFVHLGHTARDWTDDILRLLLFVLYGGTAVWLVGRVRQLEAQHASSASDERLRGIIDNAQAMVWLKDVEGRFLVAKSGGNSRSLFAWKRGEKAV